MLSKSLTFSEPQLSTSLGGSPAPVRVPGSWLSRPVPWVLEGTASRTTDTWRTPCRLWSPNKGHCLRPPPQRLDTANWNSEETASWKPTMLGKRGPQSCGHPHTSLMVTVLSGSGTQGWGGDGAHGSPQDLSMGRPVLQTLPAQSVWGAQREDARPRHTCPEPPGGR